MSDSSNSQPESKSHSRTTANKEAGKRSSDAMRKAARLPQRTRLPAPTKRAGLSVPATQYAQSLANPFTGPLASVPDFPSVPSRRLRVYSRGFFSTGTANVGYVCAAPPMASRADVDSVWYSSSSYAGTSFEVNTATPGVLSGRTNSDYNNAEFGPGTLLRGRIVSSGLRIRYSATNLNRGGTVLGVITPNLNTLLLSISTCQPICPTYPLNVVV